MKNQINRPTLTISVSGIKLKVIRVGKSVRLVSQGVATPKIRRIHSHFTYEAFFVTEGSLEIVTDAESITYERGVVIIPPHIGHYTVPKSNGCFCLLFSLESSSKNKNRCASIQKKLDDGVCRMPISTDMEYYISALARKSEEETAMSEKDVELLASLIFNELVNLLAPETGNSYVRSAESKHIGAIETYINDNFYKKIRLSDVAAQVYLSDRQVSRILQKEYGCTLSELVNEKKLASAKMMLKNTDAKISEIASHVNLGAENYFYMLFKKKYGVSPLQYRKQIRTKDKI